jgi:hypothetical protein
MIETIGRFIGRLFHGIIVGLRVFWHVLKWGTIVAVVVVLATALFVTTDADRAYRNIDPAQPVCQTAGKDGWPDLAEFGNDENRAINEKPNARLDIKFRCTVQRHQIPPRAQSGNTDAAPLRYNLAFVEFRESGAPYDLIKDDSQPFTLDELSRKVRHLGAGGAQPITQLRAVLAHLRQLGEKNYVIAFAHGWRHDARVGDGNVADLRLYAAHAARWLRERCQTGETQHCDREVTAIYLGWRGARVNEDRLRRPLEALGEWLDSKHFGCRTRPGSATMSACWQGRLAGWADNLASLFTGTTLFDRKPVSETIAPHVLTTLRSVESALAADKKYLNREANPNKLLIIGHSLGGNLLITALHDDLVKKVKRHVEGTYFEPPIGNMVLLINPAAEASKWTSIQREVWHRLAFRPGDEGASSFEDSHRFFPAHQRAVVVSITSAFAWPPGGIRTEDCAAAHNLPLGSPDVGALKPASLALHASIDAAQKKRKIGINYDSATYDLFPIFKGDLRPLAERIKRYADWLAADKQATPLCFDGRDTPPSKSMLARPISQFAEFIRDLPFQNTDYESSRTIGHLDAPRYSLGALDQALVSAKPFGTTHEIRGLPSDQLERPINYKDVPASSRALCPVSHGWLTRARTFRPPDEHGTNWDSTKLAAAPATLTSAPVANVEQPRVRMTHGFSLAGIQPITRANDPFWNMRAYDDVLAKHDGYLLSSFICAVNQFVMDEPTRLPSPPPAPPGAALSSAP